MKEYKCTNCGNTLLIISENDDPHKYLGDRYVCSLCGASAELAHDQVYDESEGEYIDLFYLAFWVVPVSSKSTQ